MNYELRVLNYLMDMTCPHCSTLRKRVSHSFLIGREALRDGKEGKVNKDWEKEAGEKEREKDKERRRGRKRIEREQRTKLTSRTINPT